MAYRRRTRILLEYLELRGRALHPGLRVRDGFLPARDGQASPARSRRRRHRSDDGSNRPGARRPRRWLERADARHCRSPDDSFDRVLLTEVLEHVEDDLGALRELRRILRPGGILAVSVPNCPFSVLVGSRSIPSGSGLGGEPIREGPGRWHVVESPTAVPAGASSRTPSRQPGFEVEILRGGHALRGPAHPTSSCTGSASRSSSAISFPPRSAEARTAFEARRTPGTPQSVERGPRSVRRSRPPERAPARAAQAHVRERPPQSAQVTLTQREGSS